MKFITKLLLPLSIVGIMTGASLARADDDNTDENVANSLNLNDQASDAFGISPVVDCNLMPCHPSCYSDVDTNGFFPYFNERWVGGLRNYHHYHVGPHHHHRHMR